ncbi:MAG TPA: PilZ domain-containing protein [Gemmataceae bacterium]|nr:PilZ domain-containing protein [Gemmataceae bacterium]
MPDRRAFVRYRPNRELPCWVNVVLVGSSWLAEVVDISTDGIGISSACWLPAESHLLVRLANADNIARTFLAHVRHATPRAGGDFHLGARLVNHLSEEQVRELTRK